MVTIVEDKASNRDNELIDQLNLHQDTIYLMQQADNISIAYTSS